MMVFSATKGRTNKSLQSNLLFFHLALAPETPGSAHDHWETMCFLSTSFLPWESCSCHTFLVALSDPWLPCWVTVALPANEPAGNSAASYCFGPCHVELAGSTSFKAKSVSLAQHARSGDVESFAAPAACQRARQANLDSTWNVQIKNIHSSIGTFRTGWLTPKLFASGPSVLSTGKSPAMPELAVRPFDARLVPQCNSDNECNGCL